MLRAGVKASRRLAVVIVMCGVGRREGGLAVLGVKGNKKAVEKMGGVLLSVSVTGQSV